MYAPPNREQIKSALNFSMIGFLIWAVSEFLWGGIVLTDSIIIMENEEMTTAGGVLCLSGLLELVAIIILGIGIYKLYDNAESVSSSHKTKVIGAGVLLLVTLIVGIVFGMTASGFEGTEFDFESMATSTAIVGLVTSILFGIMVVLMVHEISKEEHKNYLYAVFFAYIAMNVAMAWWLLTFPSGGGLDEISMREGTYSVLQGVFSSAFAGMFFLVRENLSLPTMGQRPPAGPSMGPQPPAQRGAPQGGGFYSDNRSQQQGPPRGRGPDQQGPSKEPYQGPSRDSGYNTESPQPKPETPPPKQSEETNLYRDEPTRGPTDDSEFGFQTSQSPGSQRSSRFCTGCGSELQYIEDYGGWYCDSCDEYK